MSEPAWATGWDEAPKAVATGGEREPAWAQDWNKAAPTKATGKAAPDKASPPRPKTQFQRAAPAKEEPELTWGETLSGARENFVPSLKGVGSAMVEAVKHPVKTAQTLGQLAVGAGSQAMGAVGIQQDPKTKAEAEGLVRALEGHYKEAYGSAKGFKKNLATDPASVLMDAGTLVGGVGSGAKVAGLTRTASALSKTANALDPVQAALSIAKVPVKVAAKTVQGAQSFYTGKSAKAFELAGNAGKTKDPALKEAFRSHIEGRADPQEIVDAAGNALAQISRERGEKYVADMKALKGGQLAPIDWAPVNRALASNTDATVFKHSGSGKASVVNEGANKALEEIKARIDEFQSEPLGSNSHTLEGFDALKRSIGDIRNAAKNDPVAYQKTTAMYNAVLDAIKTQEPEYARIMQDYAHASDRINEIGATFSLSKRGKKPTRSSILNKIKNAGRDELKTDLLSQLAERDPRIPYMIAGHELQPLFPGGIRAAVGAAMSPGAFAVNPLVAAGHMAALSPRIMGEVSAGAGSASKLVGKATQPGVTRGAYYGERAGETADPEERAQIAATVASPADIDAATRMIMGEAGGESDEGKIAAMHTALNRVRRSGVPLKEVINRPHAFEAVTSGRTAGIDPNSDEYRRIRDEIVIPILAGEVQDNTDGATHFINKDLQLSEGRQIPKWAAGDGKKIGAHTFYRGEYASGGAVSSDIEPHLSRLMRAAEHAKRAGQKATEPLLNEHDDTVAHALAVAGRDI